MASQKEIRRRIRTVQKTQQITSAMRMVSAAKLRRAQDAIIALRPYSQQIWATMYEVGRRQPELTHPLTRVRPEPKRLELVVIASDRGLCGAFNANVIRAAAGFLAQRDEADLSLDLVGRRGRDYFKRRRYNVRSQRVGVFQPLVFSTARELSTELLAAYRADEFDEVHLVYNEFKSVIQQKVVVEQLLPIRRLDLQPEEPAQDYIYEPSPAVIFSEILPRHVEFQVWRSLLESAAAEHGARMAAMDAATNNAAEMIEKLTLYMKKVRQAKITNEIIEVVSGAGSPA
jgi:F-type H+-transporting ATPase subunit gamma